MNEIMSDMPINEARGRGKKTPIAMMNFQSCLLQLVRNHKEGKKKKIQNEKYYTTGIR